MGDAAHESVRQKFLLPRLTADYLRAVKAGLSSNGSNGTNGSSNGHANDAFEGMTGEVGAPPTPVLGD